MIYSGVVNSTGVHQWVEIMNCPFPYICNEMFCHTERGFDSVSTNQHQLTIACINNIFLYESVWIFY